MEAALQNIIRIIRRAVCLSCYIRACALYFVCGGYNYRIYSDENTENLIDEFTAAMGFELPDGSKENAELFAKEMVDSEYKEYCRIVNDLNFGSITM